MIHSWCLCPFHTAKYIPTHTCPQQTASQTRVSIFAFRNIFQRGGTRKRIETIYNTDNFPSSKTEFDIDPLNEFTEHLSAPYLLSLGYVHAVSNRHGDGQSFVIAADVDRLDPLEGDIHSEHSLVRVEIGWDPQRCSLFLHFPSSHVRRYHHRK